jgi:ubiquinone/menaquinone biosynthesis C-methylase UbiE
MLEQARQHVRTEGWRNVELVRDDAVNIGSISTPVDAVTSAWCLGIVYDLDAALRRAVEVLRPGGKLSILDFGRSRPDHGPLWWLFPLYRCALQVTGIDAAEDLNKVGHRNDIYR